VGIRKERILPIGKAPSFSVPAQLGIALAKKPERVVVGAQPDVETVFLDAAGRASAGCPLAAEAPPQLIKGNVIPSLMLWPRQLESRGDRRAAATNNRHFQWLLAAQFQTSTKVA
jgi:hypothetical protein